MELELLVSARERLDANERLFRVAAATQVDVLGAQVETRAGEIWEEIGPGRAYLGDVVNLHVESALAEVEQALRGKLKHLNGHDQDHLRELVRRAAKRHAHYHILDLRKLGSESAPLEAR